MLETGEQTLTSVTLARGGVATTDVSYYCNANEKLWIKWRTSEMNLLPRAHTQFQLKSYWDKFFSKRSTPFEWYGEYVDLCHVIHKYVKSGNKTLVVGCGNSKLSEDMYDAGITDITNIDISEVVIKKMSARNFEKRPHMVFTQMDMLAMSFSDGSFDCVLDKGTLDAIYSNTDDVTVTKVDRMWGEVARVLKVGGRYVCITLAQEHILTSLLLHFKSGWLLRAHKVVLNEDNLCDNERGSGVGASLPVVMFVFTKMMTVPGKPAIQVLEVVGEDGKCVRCAGVEGVREFVMGAQQQAMLRHHLRSLHPGDPAIQVQMWSDTVDEGPRYTFTIVDLHKRVRAKNGPFAIFIVPHGRESEWIFNSESGLASLADQSCYQRLVVVSLHTGHRYGDLQQVKDEVSGSALTMLQDGVPHDIKLPVLSTGQGLGYRVCLCDGVSVRSGRWRVEECGEEGERVRRLVFSDAVDLIQTEVRLRPAKVSQKKKKNRSSSSSLQQLDLSHLTFTHHRAMLAGLCLSSCLFLSRSDGGGGGGAKGRGGRVEGRVLIVGLGGGALPTYIQRHLPQVSVDVCEVDQDLVKVAETWFGFKKHSDRMTVHIEDGVQFVHRKAASTEGIEMYSAIILDVDSKDLSAGMSSPPLTFVDPTFLTAARILLKKDGILMTNVAARNQLMKTRVLQAFDTVYSCVVCMPLNEDLNDVVVGMNQCRSDGASTAGQSALKVDDGQSPIDTSIYLEDTQCDSLGEAPLSSLHTQTSSSNGGLLSCVEEDVKGRVSELVKVIGENRGDVEELESELIGFMTSITIFKSATIS